MKGFKVLDIKEGRTYLPTDKDNDFVINAHGELKRICYSGDRGGESVFIIKRVKQEDYKIIKED